MAAGNSWSDKKWIAALLTVAVVVLLNIASSTLFFRADLTRNKSFSLSDISKRSVSTLEEPLTIKVFLSKNLPAPYNNTEQVLRDMLEEYALSGNRFFNYTIVEMPSNEELANGQGLDKEDEARKYRIFPVQIQNVEQDEVKLQNAYLGVVFIHGDVIETIPALTAAENLEYIITSIIRELGNKISALLALDGTIDVTLYLSENMNALGGSIQTLPDNLSRSVDELNQQYYGKIRFSVTDPVSTGMTETLETFYNVDPLTLSRRTADGETKEQAYAALIIQSGEDFYAQSLLSEGIFGMQIADVGSLRRTIEDVVEAIIGVNDEIGYVTGFGIPDLSGANPSQGAIVPIQPDMRNFNALVSTEYELRPVDLAQEEIPEGLRCLVVAGPTGQLTEYDIFKIDQYLMKGGSVALFLDSHSIFMPQQSQFGQNQQPAYIPRNTGLEDLIAHYGVDLERAFVLDEECFIDQRRSANGGIVETRHYYAPIISDDQISEDYRFIENIPELIALYPAPLRVNGNLPDEVIAIELLRSSDRAWAVSEDINLTYPQLIQPPPDDVKRSIPLAYVLEGSFTSFFAGLPAPEPVVQGDGDAEPPDNIEVVQSVVERGSGTLFVMSTSAVLGSNILQADPRTPNALFTLNLLDFLAGNEDNAAMRTKGISYVPLEDTTPQVRSFLKTLNTAILPILVVAAGVLVWLSRMKRRTMIESFFSERTHDAQ